jgi:hypothetical protein
MADFRISEIENAEKDHDHVYKFHIVVSGTANKSKHLSITDEELNKIKAVLTEQNGEKFRTLKNLNSKIRDFEMDNLKPYNYAELINELIAFKQHAEQGGRC